MVVPCSRLVPQKRVGVLCQEAYGCVDALRAPKGVPEAQVFGSGRLTFQEFVLLRLGRVRLVTAFFCMLPVSCWSSAGLSSLT
jgi:hypothetical protein